MATKTRLKSSTLSSDAVRGDGVTLDVPRQVFRQEFGTVRDNPVGLDLNITQRICEMLNKDVASLFVLYHQYLKHHWTVEGPEWHDLHLTLEKHYLEVQIAGDAIAERINDLGGIPVSHPVTQAKMAYFKSEPDSLFDLRFMLENDLNAEKVISTTLREHIRECIKQNDFGTEQLLKPILLATERRAAHLSHFLADESLTLSLIDVNG